MLEIMNLSNVKDSTFLTAWLRGREWTLEARPRMR